MPCTYDGPYSVSHSYNCGHQEELDKLTRMLCEAMAALEKQDNHNKLSRETEGWWKKHQEFDRKRREAEKAKVEQEKLKKEALKKLSAAERKALGLK